MPMCILDAAMQAEHSGDLDPALDWPDMSEPCMPEPSVTDATRTSSNAAGRPRAELKCPEIRVQRLGEIDSEPSAWLSPNRTRRNRRSHTNREHLPGAIERHARRAVKASSVMMTFRSADAPTRKSRGGAASGLTAELAAESLPLPDDLVPPTGNSDVTR